MRRAFALLAIHALLVTWPAAAAVQKFTGEYTVSFLGFTVAESTVTTTFGDNKVIARASLASAGLAKFFDKTYGTVIVRARVGEDSLEPELFRLAYTSGKKKQRTEIRFAEGGVAKTLNTPPLRKRIKKTWVPVGKKDLLAVLDPLSAALVRASSLKQVCGRTIRAYDGEMRADLVLTQQSYGEIDIPGYKGPTVTCTAKYKPVSGYRKDRKELISLRDRSELAITFAPLGKTGIYVPVHATAGTEVGTVTVRARRTEATN